ncbi:AAA family ATPase [Saccharothrix variisporea]|uniref:AAA domain-containing protein n=1 Tax=Saccharothrix variisporea TaxID=543527 RepID=A0A495X1D4_9PSEU|nr:AAA family ATPase [Saccharothrix variisporea]RKT67730.1 AAA domain-containing protein [Saccharothrix variisporea]
MTEPVPVLWLCGPPGVGKSTVGWALHQRLRDSGVAAAYVDLDQLGICYPEPPSDPGRHRMQARNLDLVVAHLGAAGARCVVVAGVVDVTSGVPADLLPHATVTLGRLDTDPAVLRARLLERPAPADFVDLALAEASVVEPGVVFRVDTTRLPVSEVVDEVLSAAGDWLATPRVLWLCGATGVGKSTVGFAVYQRLLRAGHTAAYVDLDQIAGHGPLDHGLRARVVSDLWRTYRAAGARTLVLTGPVAEEAEVAVYAEVLPPIALYRLHASPDHLAARIASRAAGGSWAQPGDPLRDLPAADLRRITARAVAEAELLDQRALGHRIDTDDHDPEHLADVIAPKVW